MYQFYFTYLTEKAMAPHSSTLAWKIPWTEEPAKLQSMESLELDTTERLHFHFSFLFFKFYFIFKLYIIVLVLPNIHFHALEKEMATHSSVLAWRIPGTGKHGGLLSMGSHRVRHD